MSAQDFDTLAMLFRIQKQNAMVFLLTTYKYTTENSVVFFDIMMIKDFDTDYDKHLTLKITN